MALNYSTYLRDRLLRDVSMQRALQGGVFRIYSGSAPATADAAVTGTLLDEVSLASGTWTPGTLATGIVNLTGGASGNVSSITVDGYEVLGATVTYATSLTVTAGLIAAQINSYQGPGLKMTATSSGADVTISVLPGTGTTLNGKTIAVTSATITTTINGVSSTTVGGAGATAGVASVNGLTFGATASGVLSKSGIWSGVVASSGTAGYFRITGPQVDAGGATGTTQVRVQGTCGTSGADYNMSSTTLTALATHTIDTFTITRSAS